MLPLLKIENLSVAFHSENQKTIAVKSISLQVNKGEIMALVGESGSGKSVTSLSIPGLLPPSNVQYSGKIIFSEKGGEAIDLLALKPHEKRAIRGGQIAMIFQEPMTSLNPVMTCGKQVMEALVIQNKK